MSGASARRGRGALLLAALALAAAATLALLPGGDGGEGGAGATRRAAGAAPLDRLAHPGLDRVAGRRGRAGAGGDGDPARGAVAAAGEVRASDPRSPRPLVDLLVLAGDGTSFFGVGPGTGGAVDMLDDRLAFWVAPAVVARDAGGLAGESPRALEWPTRATSPRTGSAPGWYAAFPRPAREADVALMFGDLAVARAPIPPGADAVELRVHLPAIEAAASTLLLSLPPGAEGEALRLRPRPRGFPRSRVLAPDAILDGDRWRFEGLPPGRVTVRSDLSTPTLSALARRIAAERGVQPTGRWPHFGDGEREAFERHLEAAQRLRPVALEVAVDLRPGETRDLGVLAGEPAGAAVLRVSRDGAPAAARALDVRAAGGAGATVTLTCGDRLAVLGPAAGETRLHVSPARFGDEAAGYALLSVRLAALRPGGHLPEVPCELLPAATFRLPPGAELCAPDGAAVPDAALVSGPGPGGVRRFRVPAGPYVVTLPGGEAHVVAAPGGAFIDALASPPRVLEPEAEPAAEPAAEPDVSGDGE